MIAALDLGTAEGEGRRVPYCSLCGPGGPGWAAVWIAIPALFATSTRAPGSGKRALADHGFDAPGRARQGNLREQWRRGGINRHAVGRR